MLIIVQVAVLLFLNLGPYQILFRASAENIKSWYPHWGTLFLSVRHFITPVLIGILLIELGALFKLKSKAISVHSKPGKPELLLLSITLLFTLCLSEIVLRYQGYKPGKYIYLGCTEVDSLIELKGKYTDEDGIYKVSPDARKEICDSLYAADTDSAHIFHFDYRRYAEEDYSLARDFWDVSHGKYQNRFASTLSEIKKKKNWSAIDSAIVAYSRCPVNGDGFKSIEFLKVPNTTPSVLLIGDSYVWGHTTINHTNSFADILLCKGYTIYNAGIGGADPPQYLAVAKKYIPILKPGIVVVNFNLSNDIQYFNRILSRDTPMVWWTNAGFLLSCPDGVYFKSKDEAYQFDIGNTYIPATSVFNKFCSKTVLTTLLWHFLSKHFDINMVSQEMKKRNAEAAKLQQKAPYSNTQMEEIKAICEQNNSAFVLTVLPAIYRNDEGGKVMGVSRFPDLFPNLPYIECPKYPISYFTGDHFNDTGHDHYAIFLQGIIDSVSKAK